MVTKAEDFNEWYNEVVDKAGLTDMRYPIKGMNAALDSALPTPPTPFRVPCMARTDRRRYTFIQPRPIADHVIGL
ncbi:MAG TPA: hypothetical protein VJ400_07735 [Thermoplasmata archaeon]|nr:hypothetical protein [Thermoplasmata archaeon]